jgi:hypothetical protein
MGILTAVPADAKALVDTLVQLIGFLARGVINSRFNTNPIHVIGADVILTGDRHARRHRTLGLPRPGMSRSTWIRQ